MSPDFRCLRGSFSSLRRKTAAKAIYEDQYHPIMTLKALSCFEGGDLGSLNKNLKNQIIQIVEKIDLEKVPYFNSEKLIGQ